MRKEKDRGIQGDKKHRIDVRSDNANRKGRRQTRVDDTHACTGKSRQVWFYVRVATYTIAECEYAVVISTIDIRMQACCQVRVF
jgi:hypothetical protein